MSGINHFYGNVTDNGHSIMVYYSPHLNVQHVQLTVRSNQFNDWLGLVTSQECLNVKSILIQDIDMFGPRPGFIKLRTDVDKLVDEDGKQSWKRVPGIVFMRGGAVGILVILIDNETQKKYTLLTKQARVAAGYGNFIEIPAGMLDGSGNFKGIAAKEMEDETGIVVNGSDLFDLTNWAYGNAYKGMYPSAGGCDEFLRLFVMERKVTHEYLQSLQDKLTGEEVEDDGNNEIIHLEVVPYDDLWRVAPDAKALGAAYLYEKWLASKKTN